MRTPTCPACELPLAVADTAAVKRGIELVSANTSQWRGRLNGSTCLVCPKCDAYALGIETRIGVPFYSDVLSAFLTVHDWDWWNADTVECDSRTWPDFGCVTISESGVRAAVDYVRSAARPARAPAAVARPRLAEIAGLPPGREVEPIWRDELRKLELRMGSRYAYADLEAAVVLLLDVLARHPWQQTSLDHAIADEQA
ncbi:hypothetical protein GCM10008101_27930 [Lysobacter xinjiangensis]|uniref:CpXC protein n=1 Tax=Cognatilysobacter xinjiangensis TaxID=546892 RepID=A0ABQ3C8D0_9GAMM|nr:hypothetical protein [Lysobacter xinjiangensis]GGZ72106.1 hypothetical protein GCM10008101_27930 [Lysobacter xinjiangensis]